MLNNIITEDKLILRLQEISKNGILDAEDADRSENMHRLFMYPAMMVPAAQSAIIQAFSDILPPNTYAIDPFMGSGTSLLSCIEFGFNVFGQDINPFAQLSTYLFPVLINGFRRKLKFLFPKFVEPLMQKKILTIDISFGF